MQDLVYLSALVASLALGYLFVAVCARLIGTDRTGARGRAAWSRRTARVQTADEPDSGEARAA